MLRQELQELRDDFERDEKHEFLIRQPFNSLTYVAQLINMQDARIV